MRSRPGLGIETLYQKKNKTENKSKEDVKSKENLSDSLRVPEGLSETGNRIPCCDQLSAECAGIGEE